MVKKLSENKAFFYDILKGSLISLVVSGLLTFILAIVMNFCQLSDSMVIIINQVIKTIAIFIGCVLGFKEKRLGALKGFLSGSLYFLLSYLISSIIEKSFSVGWNIPIDFALVCLLGMISGILVINLKRK